MMAQLNPLNVNSFLFIIDVLTEADLSTLMNLLQPVAYRWNDLCLQLGVLQSDLNNIAANPMRMSGAPNTFLQDGLYIWLQKEPASCTIPALCEALKSPAVDETALANEVEERLKRHKGQINYALMRSFIINFRSLIML